MVPEEAEAEARHPSVDHLEGGHHPSADLHASGDHRRLTHEVDRHGTYPATPYCERRDR